MSQAMAIVILPKAVSTTCKVPLESNFDLLEASRNLLKAKITQNVMIRIFHSHLKKTEYIFLSYVSIENSQAQTPKKAFKSLNKRYLHNQIYIKIAESLQHYMLIVCVVKSNNVLNFYYLITHGWVIVEYD